MDYWDGPPVRIVSASPWFISMTFTAIYPAGSSRRRPLVMTGRDNPALMEFQRSLVVELMRNGLRCEKSPKFNPHVTLFRGAGEIPRQSVEAVTWTVGEIVLIRSIIGEGRHEHLGRWSLGG
jgi:2'-5' RNA ligase